MERFIIMEKNRLSKRTKAAAYLIFLIIPLTIALGVQWLKSSGYNATGRIIYIMSVVIIFESMIPFLLIFEKRKPRQGNW